MFVAGCAYRLGTPGARREPLAIRLEFENMSGVHGLSGRLLAAFEEEARGMPGVRLVAGSGMPVKITMKQAARAPLSVDDLGRPVEERMRLVIEVTAAVLPEPLALDSADATAAIHRARRGLSPEAAEDAALHSLARSVLGILLLEDSEDAGNRQQG